MSLESKYLNFDQVMELLDKKIDEVVTSSPPIIDFDKIIDGVRNINILSFLTNINPLKVCVATQTDDHLYSPQPTNSKLDQALENQKELTCLQTDDMQEFDNFSPYNDQEQNRWFIKSYENRKKMLDDELDAYFALQKKKEANKEEREKKEASVLRRSQRIINKKSF
jgi:hypothetical protein